jgi:hypothetical protein
LARARFGSSFFKYTTDLPGKFSIHLPSARSRLQVAQDCAKRGFGASFAPCSVAKSFHFATLRDKLISADIQTVAKSALFATVQGLGVVNNVTPSRCSLIWDDATEFRREAVAIRRDADKHRDVSRQDRDGSILHRDGFAPLRDGSQRLRDGILRSSGEEGNFATLYGAQPAKAGS